MRDPLALARVYWMQSRVHVLHNDPGLARQYAERALEILKQTENNAHIAMAYHLLAYTEIESGRPGGSPSAASSRRSTRRRPTAVARSRSSPAGAGERARARDLYERSPQHLDKQGRHFVVDVARKYADFLEEEGDPQRALEVLREAVPHSQAAVLDRARDR